GSRSRTPTARIEGTAYKPAHAARDCGSERMQCRPAMRPCGDRFVRRVRPGKRPHRGTRLPPCSRPDPQRGVIEAARRHGGHTGSGWSYLTDIGFAMERFVRLMGARVTQLPPDGLADPSGNLLRRAFAEPVRHESLEIEDGGDLERRFVRHLDIEAFL